VEKKVKREIRKCILLTFIRVYSAVPPEQGKLICGFYAILIIYGSGVGVHVNIPEHKTG
jgi:hypothetical protein